MDADVFALAAIGVGIEVADEGAFNGGACAGIAGSVRPRSCGASGSANVEFANGARLGVAHGGSGGVANGVDGGFGLLAEADDEEPFGFQSGGGVEEDRLVGAGLEFAAGEHRSCGGADGFVVRQQDRLRA